MALVTGILLLLVLVPLVVLAVRSAMLIVRLLSAERHEPGGPIRRAPGRQERLAAAAGVDAPAAGRLGDSAGSTTSAEDTGSAEEPGAEESDEERAAVTVAPEESRACAVCGGRVLATARVCRHCGAILSS